jgi:prophage maintenance system killer protein
MTAETQAPIIIFEDAGKAVEVRLDADRETVWLTQEQMTVMFDVQKAAESQHLKNIYRGWRTGTRGNSFHFGNSSSRESARSIRQIEHYNLDAIISVGYRVNSGRAVTRQWATRVLREHLTQGWTLNRQRFEENARELEAALALVRKAAQSPALDAGSGRGLVDIVSRYAQTFLLLQRYDEGLLTEPRAQPGGSLPTLEQARAALDGLKSDLMARGEATDLFARDRGDGLDSLLGNLDQSVFGEPAYPSVESKAAHLLYFVVKNHPFSDGNKRSAAFLFVDFLHRNGRLLNAAGEPVINDVGLAALTLLVAESDAANKETMIRLIMNMLAGAR